MLQFIIGRSGSGKTNYIQQLLCGLARDGKEKLICLVPEQLSFATEKSFLKLLGAKESRHIEVLSFSRMVDFAFRQIGGLSGIPIDDGGRSVLMSLALEQAQDQLVLYARQAHRPEFAEIMLTAVKEFKMCGISTNGLRAAAEQLDNATLTQKLNETALITDIYNALLEQNYIDPLDNLTKLSGALLEHKIFEDYTVVIDAFSGFTGAEQLVLAQLMKQCESCYITLCTSKEEMASGSYRFATTNATKRTLTNLAKANSVKVKTPVYLEKNFRTGSEHLLAVEKQLYFPEKKPVKSTCENVTLYTARDIYGECAFIAREVRRLVIEEGCRYRDIAVVCRNLDEYTGVLDAEFDAFELAYFMDKPQQIDTKPLIVFVLSALDVVHSRFSTEHILRFLKTGIAGVNPEEIAQLENYAYIWGINGVQWKSPFVGNPAGYSNEFTKEQQLELNLIERLRKKIIPPLEEFGKGIASGNGKQLSFAVYKLLEQFNAEQQIQESAQKFLEENSLEKANTQVRIWDIFISALDQTAVLLKDFNVTSRRYAQLLKTVISAQDIAFIPQGIDQITVGTADRVRLNEPKVVFLLGCVEGEFPSAPVASGVFNNTERKLLITMQLKLYDALEQLSAMEQFYAYTAAVSASQSLYASCYELSLEGEVKYPSTLFTELKAILPEIKPGSQKAESPYNNLWSEKQAFAAMAANWNSSTENEARLKEYFSKHEQYKETVSALEAYAENAPARLKNKETASKMFDAAIRLSASQVEKFYLCAFQYFCRYGLKVKERKKAEIDSAQYGSLIHYLLERLFKAYTVNELSAFSKEELETLIRQLMESYLEEYLGGSETKSKRYLHSYFKIKDAAVMLTMHMLEELLQSEFKPIDYELKIGEDIPAYQVQTDYGTVSLQGFVDRVDIYREDDKAYIRVVDYKTNSKKFVLTDVSYGLNMQMLLYLSAIVRGGREKYEGEVVPAGVLYMPAGEAYVNAAGENKEQQEKDRKKALKMNGLLLDDVHLIQAMEPDGKAVYIPVALTLDKPKKNKKDEAKPLPPTYSISGRTKGNTVSPEQMRRIFDRIDFLIAKMAAALFSGSIEAVPAKSSSYDACEYCPYTAICRYTQNTPHNEIRKDIKPYEIERLTQLKEV